MVKPSDNEGMDNKQHSPVEISETSVSPEQAKETLKTLAETDLLNLETGITARINVKQRNKLVSKKALNKSLNNGFTAGQHNATAARIDKVFECASLVDTGKDRNGDVNIVSIKHFASPVVFGDKPARIAS
jgi:preprotein translocase subunit SecF